jgi:hypothetical protein
LIKTDLLIQNSHDKPKGLFFFEWEKSTFKALERIQAVIDKCFEERQANMSKTPKTIR